LNRVVGSVLAYARPSAASRDAVDVNAVIARTVQVIQQELESGAYIRMTLASALPKVRADAEQLRQVLFNLVRNGWQAAESAERTPQIVVATAERPGPRGTNFVEVSVRDNGPGVGADVMQHLFTPFFTTKISGSGLGLAISQRLAHEMHGRIEVSSTSADGATFSLILPAVTDSALERTAVPT
jgi:C4-dicarboxylate-specific signal transduction histidine kinase